MNTEEIKKLFEKNIVIDFTKFEKLIEFKEIFCKDVSGSNDFSEFYIGLVDNRFFYYEHSNGKVGQSDFRFLDEMKQY